MPDPTPERQRVLPLQKGAGRLYLYLYQPYLQ